MGNAALPILALLLLALLALTYYTPPKPAYAGLEVKDLPNLLVEAMQGLNHSTRLLSSAVSGSRANASDHVRRMETVAALLSDADELPELRDSELGEQLRKAAASYAHAASAAARIASAAEGVSAASYELREFLEGVRRCDFLKARESAPALQRWLREALADVGKALTHLAEVDEEALLSDGHKEVYYRAAEHVSRIAKVLGNLLAAAELVQLANASALEEACLGRPAHFGPDAVEMSLRLKPSESGEFGYEIALLKSYVLGGCERCPGSGPGQQGVGGGAGWGEPQGDD